MKLVKICIFFLLALTFVSPVSAKTENIDLLLSGNDIDLLVGTPTGVKEPLDTRRTRYAPNPSQDFSNLLEDDLTTEIPFEELSWSDAEDQSATPDETEAQLLDLLAETGELEGTENMPQEEDPDKDEAISTENVETELKL